MQYYISPFSGGMIQRNVFVIKVFRSMVQLHFGNLNLALVTRDNAKILFCWCMDMNTARPVWQVVVNTFIFVGATQFKLHCHDVNL